jgi:OFA family oxalate/formate antiporter-like MFS transporter
MKKYIVLTAAIVIQLCLGGIYAWSTFVPALRSAYGYSAAQTQFIFGLTIGILCFAAIISGRIQDLCGPRLTACLSAILTGSGYLVAGFLGDRFWGLILGISILCGLGVAFGYITAVATSVKWFPGRRGLITGIIVSGYGCAAIILSTVSELLLSQGWPVLRIFQRIGFIYGPLLLLTGLILSVPAGNTASTSVRDFRRRELLKDPRFWRLTIGIFCGTFPGLALIGALKPIGSWNGFDIAVATASISALAIGNGSGRIVWGLLHDRLQSRNTDLWLLAAVTASVLLFAAGGFTTALFLGASVLLGFCYGGALAVFPSEVSRIYGVHIMGSVYPVVLTGHGIAAIIAAPLTGYGVDRSGGYWPGILMALGVAVAGLIICTAINNRDRTQPRS